MKEDKLFNKIIKKDYNNLLEELLGIKHFDENVKSLLLSMCYKIETAYSDYEKAKKNVISKDEYMKRIFVIIQKDCESIQFIKQDDNMSNKYILDKGEKKISCYPIEIDLLYCLMNMNKKDNIVKESNDVIKKAVNIMINDGNCINSCEPLRDFNGFSWNVVTKDIQNIAYNLIYQDLILVKENDFIEEWVNNNSFIIDYFEMLKDNLTEKYGETLERKIISNIIKIAIFEYHTKNQDCKNETIAESIKIKEEYEKYKDSSKYLKELGDRKKEISKKIRKIDQTINDKELLNIEYEKRNESLPIDKKIFSMKVLKKIMQEERKKYLEQLEEYAVLMNPQVFLKRNEKLKEYTEYFKITENSEKGIYSEIIDLQKNVLEVFKIKVSKASEKQEVLKLIYEFRYFCQIPVSLDKKTYNEEELSKDIEIVQELILKKAIEKKAIVQISNIEKINFNILKKIFYSTIISIDNIALKVFKEDEVWKVQFFDENIEDKVVEIEDLIEKKDIRVKLNKSVKLFT